MLQQIDHVAIAVENLEEALALYRGALQVSDVQYETNETDGFDIAIIRLGGSTVELLAPTRPDSPVARSLAKRGPGLHHVAFRVADAAEAARRCTEHGLRLVDPEPRRGSHDSRIVFLHPKSTGGTLIELVEPAPASA